MSDVSRRPWVRRGVAALLVAALGVLIVACMPPIHPDNRPSPLTGMSNGRLPASQLVAVSSACTVYYQAAPSLHQMLTDAWNDGVTLYGGSCYRDYAGQVEARNYWCGLGRCYMAAVPGTSMHGWGKAVDFAELGVDLDFGTPGFEWLSANAWRYGWNHPGWAAQGQVGAEPWHWEWVGDGGTMFPGTTIGPQA